MFHDPALGDDRKFVKFAALGNLHRDRLPQGFFDRLRKWLTHVATICQHVLYTSEISLAAAHGLQSSFAVRHLGCGHRNRVRKTWRIHLNVALDPRDLFTGVIPLERCRISIFHALRVHDQQRRLCTAPQF